MPKKLTKRQQLFVSEYLKSGNASRAAIAAGYSPNGSTVQGTRLLANASVAAAVEQKHAKRMEKIDFSAEKVLEGLANLAFFDIRKLYNEAGELKKITELDDQTAAAICGVEVEEVFERFGGGQAKANGNLLKKIKLADRGINLERLGRFHKLFTDRVEISNLDKLAEALAGARQRAKR